MLAPNNNRGMTYQTDEKYLNYMVKYSVEVVKLAHYCYNITRFLLHANLIPSLPRDHELHSRQRRRLGRVLYKHIHYSSHQEGCHEDENVKKANETPSSSVQPRRSSLPHRQMERNNPSHQSLGRRLLRISHLLQAFLLPSESCPPHKSLCHKHHCLHRWRRRHTVRQH
jgi:hypothetical protein